MMKHAFREDVLSDVYGRFRSGPLHRDLLVLSCLFTLQHGYGSFRKLASSNGRIPASHPLPSTVSAQQRYSHDSPESE